MSNSDRPGATASQKLKLLEALKQLQQEGVVIIDDSRGRPRIADIDAVAAASHRGNRDSRFFSGDSTLELEDQVGSDPYNKLI